MRNVLAASPRKALHEYFTRLTPLLGERRARAICLIADDAIRIHPQVQPALGVLQAEWYASIAAGAPDYSVYERPVYLAEVWYCWATYSRKYLRELDKAGVFAGAKSIVDLGCGTGYSTAALSQMAPAARVCGTNVLVGEQGKLCLSMAASYSFDLCANIAEVETVDAVFASEYFEHWAAPIEHLREVLARRPRLLVIANTFTSPSIGHFPSYAVDGAQVDGATASRAFNATLVDAGYRQRKDLQLWNNRPAVWERAQL